MLESQKWDYVVIQEQSINPVTDYEDFHDSVSALASLARERGATVVFCFRPGRMKKLLKSLSAQVFLTIKCISG